MDKEEAKSIPLSVILHKLLRAPVRTSGGKQWYFSPLRSEKTPSFLIDLQTNRWYDFGEGAGGDGIDLVQRYLKASREAYTMMDALRWINNMTANTNLSPVFLPSADEIASENELILLSEKQIQHMGLIRYLEKRGIPLVLAQSNLKELRLRNSATGKYFYALGFQNEEGGYELRNPFFKGSLRPKAIRFIRGTMPGSQSVHFFEGFMDYLSAVCQSGEAAFQNDVVVLNSVSYLRQAMAYVQNYSYRRAYTWMDNDKSGKKATTLLADFFKTQQGLTHVPMNRLYTAHKDVNEWHMHLRGLEL